MQNALVVNVRQMGASGQHLKLAVQDAAGKVLELLAFNAPAEWVCRPGERVRVWFQLGLNEWQGRRTVEGRLLRLEKA